MATLNQEGGGVEDGGCGEKKGVLFPAPEEGFDQ